MKKIIFSVLTVCFFVSPAAINAETVTLTAGTLGQTPTTLTFSATTLDNNSNQTATATGTITVIDNRGSGAGWSVTLAATDPTSNPIPDSTSAGGTGTYTVSIPASAISVDTPSFTLVNGQAIDPVNGPKTIGGPLSNTPKSIANAAPGFGAGKYQATYTFTLAFPHTVAIKSMTGSGSKFSVGSLIGLPAATYTTTLTYTTAAGV